MVELYQSGKSCATIGKQFGRAASFIGHTLEKNGIILRKYIEVNRKHVVNDHYFDQIDTGEKAYFLGLLFADGNVSSRAGSNAITLKLQKQDRELLLRLSTIIMDKEWLYESENNYILQFRSQRIKQQLIELGCIPNKSLKLEFPTIDPSLHSHFIRGYFDGDGCINRYKNDFYVSIMSTQNFCIATADIIDMQVEIGETPGSIEQMMLRGNDITKTLTYKGNRRVKKVLDWLYKDATIYLERKYQKYQELLDRIQDVDNNRGNRYKRAKAKRLLQ